MVLKVQLRAALNQEKIRTKRENARKARLLSETLSNEEYRQRLLEFAAESDSEADALEALQLTSGRPGSADIRLREQQTRDGNKENGPSKTSH